MSTPAASASPLSRIFERVPDAYPRGGLKADSKWINEQKGIVYEIIRQIGMNLTQLTQGKDLTAVCLPVTIFEPRSYLERMSDGWCFGPHFFKKASETSDPVERLKYIIAFAISGLHKTTKASKPFNPILGETFEGYYDDGTLVYGEQSSHHPPVSNWLLVGPEEAWKFYGFGEWMVSFRGNSLKGCQQGPHTMEFKDGGKVVYNLPDIWIEGFLFGDHVVEYIGTMKFVYIKGGKEILRCNVEIPIPGRNVGFFSSWWGTAEPQPPSDHLYGEIKSTEVSDDRGEGSLVSVLQGSWVGCVEFDGKKYWDFSEGIPAAQVKPVDNPLPSDSRFREDLVHLKDKDLDGAAEWKVKLENIQRAEEKMRKAAKAARKTI